MDDATLTDPEERTLEGIRRQLDAEFPHTTRGVVFAWHTDPEPERRRLALPPGSRTGRVTRVVLAVGALLLVFAAGGAAGALLTAYYSRELLGPAGERDLPSTPARVTRPLPPLPLADKAPAPRPRPATPAVTPPAVRPSSPPVVATPAPAPELLPPVPPASGNAAAVAPPIAAPRRSAPESP